MLRRPPTTLTLTSEDIAIYEDKRSREATQRRSNHQTHSAQAPNRYDAEELLANNNSHNPYSHLPPTHPKRRTILDPPLPAARSASSVAAAAQIGGNWEAASEQDLRDFAAQQQQHRHQQQQRHHQRRAAGAGHGVHFTPVPRGGGGGLSGNATPSNGAGMGVGGVPVGDDSDLIPAAGLSSPPEASALASSSDDEDQEDEDEDEDGDESVEDEEMVDYDAPGQIQALPRSARVAAYPQQQQQQQQQYQPSQHHHATSATTTTSSNLQTPVNNAAAQGLGAQLQQQHTPVPSNHTTAAATSQIPQAPMRRTHGRAVSARGGGPGGVRTVGPATAAGESQAPTQPPPAPTRMTRSRDERIGAPPAGMRRTGR